MFINVKKFLMSDFLLKINNEKLSERTYNNDNDVFVIIFAFN